jgi:hypothetical protein
MTENNVSTTETLEQLQQQKRELEKKINRQMAIERNRKLNSIVSDMQNYNISLGDIDAAFNAKKQEKIVRYINPETGATWSGSGKRPKWIIEALNAGKNLEDFAVKN